MQKCSPLYISCKYYAFLFFRIDRINNHNAHGLTRVKQYCTCVFYPVAVNFLLIKCKHISGCLKPQLLKPQSINDKAWTWTKTLHVSVISSLIPTPQGLALFYHLFLALNCIFNFNFFFPFIACCACNMDYSISTMYSQCWTPYFLSLFLSV